MTRINVVEVSELENMHLLAEYRELPRVFKLASNFYISGKTEDFPLEYTLGKGHVKFFYNKLKWLYARQLKLIAELEKRGFNITFKNPEELLTYCPSKYFNDYEVTSAALKINRERIANRLQAHSLKLGK